MSVILLGVAPPRAEGPPPVVASHGNMTLSSNRGTVYLQGDAEALMGWEGFGPVQRRANRSTPLGRDGTIRNRIRPFGRGERRITGPVHLAGGTARQRAELMDRVIDICSPLDGSEVTLSLSRYDEPVYCTGDALFSGGSEFMAEAAYDSSAVVQLDLSCPDPNFYSAEVRRARQVDPAGEPFFPIGPVKISDSTGFGSTMRLEVGGTWPTYAEIGILGPLETLDLTWSDGRVFALDLTADPLLGGERITVRTDPASAIAGALRVEGPGGASYWRYVTGRVFRPLQPGKDTVLLDVTGQSGNTEVSLTWRSAYQAVS